MPITIYPNSKADTNLYKQLAKRLNNRIEQNKKGNLGNGNSDKDPYFDDPENIKEINAGIEDVKAGRVTKIKDPSNLWEGIQ